MDRRCRPWFCCWSTPSIMDKLRYSSIITITSTISAVDPHEVWCLFFWCRLLFSSKLTHRPSQGMFAISQKRTQDKPQETNVEEALPPSSYCESHGSSSCFASAAEMKTTNTGETGVGAPSYSFASSSPSPPLALLHSFRDASAGCLNSFVSSCLPPTTRQTIDFLIHPGSASATGRREAYRSHARYLSHMEGPPLSSAELYLPGRKHVGRVVHASRLSSRLTVKKKSPPSFSSSLSFSSFVPTRVEQASSSSTKYHDPRYSAASFSLSTSTGTSMPSPSLSCTSFYTPSQKRVLEAIVEAPSTPHSTSLQRSQPQDGASTAHRMGSHALPSLSTMTSSSSSRSFETERASLRQCDAWTSAPLSVARPHRKDHDDVDRRTSPPESTHRQIRRPSSSPWGPSARGRHPSWCASDLLLTLEALENAFFVLPSGTTETKEGEPTWIPLPPPLSSSSLLRSTAAKGMPPEQKASITIHDTTTEPASLFSFGYPTKDVQQDGRREEEPEGINERREEMHKTREVMPSQCSPSLRLPSASTSSDETFLDLGIEGVPNGSRRGRSGSLQVEADFVKGDGISHTATTIPAQCLAVQRRIRQERCQLLQEERHLFTVLQQVEDEENTGKKTAPLHVSMTFSYFKLMVQRGGSIPFATIEEGDAMGRTAAITPYPNPHQTNRKAVEENGTESDTRKDISRQPILPTDISSSQTRRNHVWQVILTPLSSLSPSSLTDTRSSTPSRCSTHTILEELSELQFIFSRLQYYQASRQRRRAHHWRSGGHHLLQGSFPSLIHDAASCSASSSLSAFSNPCCSVTLDATAAYRTLSPCMEVTLPWKIFSLLLSASHQGPFSRVTSPLFFPSCDKQGRVCRLPLSFIVSQACPPTSSLHTTFFSWMSSVRESCFLSFLSPLWPSLFSSATDGTSGMTAMTRLPTPTLDRNSVLYHPVFGSSNTTSLQVSLHHEAFQKQKEKLLHAMMKDCPDLSFFFSMQDKGF